MGKQEIGKPVATCSCRLSTSCAKACFTSAALGASNAFYIAVFYVMSAVHGYLVVCLQSAAQVV